MSYRNIRLVIEVGNVESRILGPTPVALLDGTLNRHVSGLSRRSGDLSSASQALIYRPGPDRILNGALPVAKRVLRRNGIRFRVRDSRLPARPRFRYRIQGHALRDYQEHVVREALARGRGVVDVGTGGGKTRIATELIARTGLPTLYLVTTRTLLEQATASLRQDLGIEPGVMGAGTHRPGPVTVALVQTLLQRGRDLAPWRDGCVIWDEGHHSAAPTFLALTRRIDARYNFFLSAVPFRSGKDQALLDALTGGSLTGGAYSAEYLIEHGYAAPVKVRIETVPLRGDMLEKPFWQLYQEFIVANGERNEAIVAVTDAERRAGRSVLILVEQIRHGELLASRLGPAAELAHGGLGKRALHDVVERFAIGRTPVLVATIGLFNEGVSINGINCVVNGGGLKSRVKVLQALGRGMRLAPGKKHVLYADFYDDCLTGVFRAHSRQRIRILRNEGFAVPPVTAWRPVQPPEEEVEPAWSHIPGTEKFVQFAGDGRVMGRGRCLEKSLVPETLCRSCSSKVCQEGGEITWCETQA